MFHAPNQQIIVGKLCALENAPAGLVFSSGMAAISTSLTAMLRPGDHVVMQDGVYGGTRSFAAAEFESLGIEVTFVKTEAAPWSADVEI